MQPDVLRALADRPNALVTIASLPSVWALDVAAATELLAALIDACQVQVWEDAPNGPAVILSQSSAQAFGLTLEPAGESWRWVSGDRVRVNGGTKELILSDVTEHGAETFEDPRAIDPAIAAALVDEYLGTGKVHPLELRHLVRSFLVLGAERWQWPEALDAEVCFGHPPGELPETVVCLICLHRGDPRMHQVRQTASTLSDEKRLAGGVGKAETGRVKGAKPRRRRRRRR